ncbi:MAG: hypothetical protein AMR96_06440 [Candidatus Adiutrix intracellularis]|jgi:uncharacterized lipoprotein YmbA|nr:MAG: hypothetical protein AMR96_06440 [Candidatus Adiutrix intracellularis]MDR2826472.1 PqiC family protein [Candidatus Adiutrix intracellularis]
MTSPGQIFTLFLLSLTAVLSSACLSQPHPALKYFTLETKPETFPGADIPAPNRRTLLIGTVTTTENSDGQALIYRLGDNHYEPDFYNVFIAPPVRLLADTETQHLNRTSHRLRVVDSPGLTLADFGLETYIEALHGDYRPTPPLAVLNLRFTLNDLRPTQSRVVLDKTYPCLWPLKNVTPDGLVAALSLCLTDSLNRLVRELDEVAH